MADVRRRSARFARTPVSPQQLELLVAEARTMLSRANAADVEHIRALQAQIAEYEAMLTIAWRRGGYDGTVWNNAGVAID